MNPSTRQVTVTGTLSSARSGPTGTSFWVDVPRQVRHSTSYDLGLLFEQLDPFTGFSPLRGLIRSWALRVGVDTVLAVGDLQPAMRAPFRGPEVLRDLTQRGLALAGDGDDVAAKNSAGDGFGMGNILPS